MLNRVAPVLILCLVSGAAFAQEQRCNVPQPITDIQARLYAVDRTASPLLIAGPSNDPSCPSTQARCALPGYEVTVDEVVGIFTRGDFTCVLYVMPDDPWGLPYRAGFLPAAILTPLAAGEVDWSGTWTTPYQMTTIALTEAPDGAVHIEGVSSNMEKTANTVAKNIYREDVISEDVMPRKYTLAFEQTADEIAPPYQGGLESCQVRMWRAGAYLLVSDNPYCGAPDVYFTGFYTRKSAD